MKKSTNYLFLLVFMTSAAGLCADAHDRAWSEYEKVIKKTFSFNTSQPSILLDNSYGNLTIVSASRQDASIEVTITVETKNKSRADEMFEHIDVEFDDDPDKLKVRTYFIGKRGGWGKKNEKYNIDYKVSLPEETFLSLKNTYGDISLTTHRNDVEIILKYGSGSLQNVIGDLDVNLAYADRFNVGEVSGNLKSKLAYSHLAVDKGQIVDCISSYSDVTLDEIEKIDCDSKYDDFTIGSVKEIELDDKYSNYSIGSVSDIFIDMAYSAIKIKDLSIQGDFDTSYGSVNIRKVKTTAQKIDIDAGHTEYRIGYDGGMTLDIETEYTNVNYPDDLSISFRDKDDNELNLKGSKKGVGNLKITANMEYGSLKITN